MKQNSEFLLKIGKQDWFQLLVMCDRFESSTLNRIKFVEV